MQNYKGICRNKHKHWSGWNFIDTYHNIARDNYETFLEADKPLQNLVRGFYFKQKLNILLFNLSVYGIVYIMAILIKG